MTKTINRSINNKIWQQKPVDKDYITTIQQNLSCNKTLATFLSTRVKNLSNIENFLNPKIKNSLPDPMHLLDMDKAVDRIIKAINEQEKIVIFGDYDVDGATSSALLKNGLKDLGINADIYIPDRILDGYGPTSKAMLNFKTNNIDLVITVDCGSTAYEALSTAKELGIDVIVVDHHLTEKLPIATAIVNPNRIDETSNYKNLAAVGVSFLLLVGIVSKLKQSDFFVNKTMPDLMQYLDLVALGTVCDMMSLTELNRTFVAIGLQKISKQQNLGIKYLIETSSINYNKITPYHLSFILGPKINAGGRVGEAALGSKLLTTNSNVEAKQHSIALDEYNNQRKLIEEQMLNEAFEMASLLQEQHCLVLAKEGWHQGLIGIIASKIKEKFNKPTIIIAIIDDISKASCRSVKQLDLGNKILLAKEQGLLLAGGGHAQAAGFTIITNKIKEFTDFINTACSDLIPNLHEEYDLELSINDIDNNLMNILRLLEPYGNGNPEPLVKLSDVFLLKSNILANKHIKCLFSHNKYPVTKTISAIMFNGINSASQSVLIDYTDNISLIGNLKINEWNNNSTVELYIKDIIL